MCIVFHFADVSENRLTRTDGLDALPQLSNLNIAKNALSTADSIENLTGCKQLTSVNFSHNELESEDVITTLSRILSLLSITMTGNPIAANVSNFRKKAIVAVKTLRYLDRPIFDMERASAEAWSTGGRDAERLVKLEWQTKKREEERKGMQDFRDWQQEIRDRTFEEKALMEANGPTPSQIAEEDEKKRRGAEREAFASQEAAREREIYQIDIPDENENENMAVAVTVAATSSNNGAENINISVSIPVSISSEGLVECEDALLSENEITPIESPSTEPQRDPNDPHSPEPTIPYPSDLHFTEIESEHTPSSVQWSQNLDKELNASVRKHNFDFDKVARELGELSDSCANVDMVPSPEGCRLRWCLLNSNQGTSE